MRDTLVIQCHCHIFFSMYCISLSLSAFSRYFSKARAMRVVCGGRALFLSYIWVILHSFLFPSSLLYFHIFDEMAQRWRWRYVEMPASLRAAARHAKAACSGTKARARRYARVPLSSPSSLRLHIIFHWSLQLSFSSLLFSLFWCSYLSILSFSSFKAYWYLSSSLSAGISGLLRSAVAQVAGRHVCLRLPLFSLSASGGCTAVVSLLRPSGCQSSVCLACPVQGPPSACCCRPLWHCSR